MGEASIEVLTELHEAYDVLAAAFSVDRAVREVLGMGPRHLKVLYEMWVPSLLENPGSIVFGLRAGQGLASVAVCQGPGPEPPFWRDVARGLPMLWRLGPRRCRLLMRIDGEFRRYSPLRPGHLRLVLLGTRPDSFRRGYAGALLKRVDEHALSCDLTKIYLEADTHGRPRKLYERHGYRTVEQFMTLAGSVDIMVKAW